MNNRRDFLKNTAALSLFTGAGMASMLGNFSASAADTSGYKALVCLFFFGGMDCHDTIIPYDPTSYEEYAAIRSNLISQHGGGRDLANLLPLTPGNAAQFGSRQFALPPELPTMHQLFQSGDAAIIGNVGPLREPVTRTEYQTQKNKLPSKLFSHNDQQSTWMASAPEGAKFGWGGRFSDAQIIANANQNPIFSAVSISGNTVFLSGDTTRPFQIGSGGAQSFDALKSGTFGGSKRFPTEASDAMQAFFATPSGSSANLYHRDVAAQMQTAYSANEQFNNALENAQALQTQFPTSSVGRSLGTIANTINLRNDLGVKRQVFFVGMGGFDTHSNQASKLSSLHSQIDGAVGAFYAAMQEMGAGLDVTLFTASDFGRTLRDNGDGTDHGWGAHHFVVGGAVQGGDIYGDIPPPEFDHQFDSGNGRLIPQLAVEQYAATLGRWFGLSQSELNTALPNLQNFMQPDLMFV